jgi:hypothetical protein
MGGELFGGLIAKNYPGISPAWEGMMLFQA